MSVILGGVDQEYSLWRQKSTLTALSKYLCWLNAKSNNTTATALLFLCVIICKSEFHEFHMHSVYLLSFSQRCNLLPSVWAKQMQAVSTAQSLEIPSKYKFPCISCTSSCCFYCAQKQHGLTYKYYYLRWLSKQCRERLALIFHFEGSLPFSSDRCT